MSGNALPTKSRDESPDGQEPTQAVFAGRLGLAIEWANVTQRELAERIGRHFTTVGCYASPTYGHGPPPPRMRRLLEERLGLPIGWLDSDAPLP